MHWIVNSWSKSSNKNQGSQHSEVCFQSGVQVKNCLCCSHQLLQHIRNNRVYWFCRNCWQEMPLLDLEIHNSLSASITTIHTGKDRLILNNKDAPRSKTTFQ
ncbi:hypothetical protein NIES4106_55840 (plasmid) [Fischerella sp. NIES-4106]|nr:hypothetical protein NIES4106_55840 [Fischerella sp. NIES-4106]